MHAKPMDMDDYLASAVLADPLRLFDSCLISDGGAAYVTTSIERARDLPQPPGRRPGRRRGDLGHGRALEPAARLHEHAAGVQRAGRVRDGRASRRPTSTCSRSTTRSPSSRSCRSRTWGSARRVRAARSSRASALVRRRGRSAVQHARRAAVARVRARHRARRRDREAAARDRAGAGAGLRGRRLRRVHGPAREHARPHDGPVAVAITRAEFPLPDVDDELTAGYFAGAARGELCIPRCDSAAVGAGTRSRCARRAAASSRGPRPPAAARCSRGWWSSGRSSRRSPTWCRS